MGQSNLGLSGRRVTQDRAHIHKRWLRTLGPGMVVGAVAAWSNLGLALANGDDIHFGSLSGGVSLAILGAVVVFAGVVFGLFILRWRQSAGCLTDPKGDSPHDLDDDTEA